MMIRLLIQLIQTRTSMQANGEPAMFHVAPRDAQDGRKLILVGCLSRVVITEAIHLRQCVDKYFRA